MSNLPMLVQPEVAEALKQNQPVVALESTVITHGLPQPDNLRLARDVEGEVRTHGAVPATVGVLEGCVHVGLNPDQLELLAASAHARKISRRDYGIALARGEVGGTTVAGTLIAANLAGIRVFATGGIGGVHRDAPNDISADLPELSRSPLVVVCAGAKAILDLPATLEYLETAGVPVIGYGVDELPAFYSRSSGLPVTARADSAEDVARIALAQWSLGITSAVLVTVPPPEEAAVPADEINRVIDQSLDDARREGVRGARVTPYLLARVSELSGGTSLRANLALLRQNARVAAQIAVMLSRLG